jgi:hypothetical protein
MEYDPNLFVPVNAETILMEGARMIDEWPIIERRIRSATLVYRKTQAAVALEVPVESLVTADMDFGFGDSAPREASGREEAIRLSPEEREVLHKVNGTAKVQDIVDHCQMGEFDTYRVLYELLNRNLIEEIKSSAAVGVVSSVGRGGEILERGAQILLLVLAVGSFLTLQSNPASPWKLAARAGETELLRTYASRARLERLDRALQLFYLDLGSVPDRLERLADAGYVTQRDLRDPWGRPYAFEVGSGGYTILGIDDSGRSRDELILRHAWSASERMVLEGGAAGEPAAPSKEKARRP